MLRNTSFKKPPFAISHFFRQKNRPLEKIVGVRENFAAVAFNEKLLGQSLFVLQTPAAENNDELSSLAAPPKKKRDKKIIMLSHARSFFYPAQGNLNVLS